MKTLQNAQFLENRLSLKCQLPLGLLLGLLNLLLLLLQ
jgi:hypothetical protein